MQTAQIANILIVGMRKDTRRTRLFLSEISGQFAICRLDSTSDIPDWALEGRFFSITRTYDELSVVCPEENVPTQIQSEGGWRCLKLEGPLDFALTGVLLSVAEPLAEAGISIFAVGTYETDYILIKEKHYDQAISVLSASGHQINRRGSKP